MIFYFISGCPLYLYLYKYQFFIFKIIFISSVFDKKSRLLLISHNLLHLILLDTCQDKNKLGTYYSM